MNFDGLFSGVTAVTDWIQTYLINGVMGNGFRVIMDGYNFYLAFKPLLDFFAAIFAAFGAA